MSDLEKNLSKNILHISVMVREVLEYLDLKPGYCVVDATVGLGGHAREILKRILPGGELIAMDQDKETLTFAEKALEEFRQNIRWIHGNFKDLSACLKKSGISQVDGILMDLGVSSYQLADRSRGFSFLDCGPLDMRMNTEEGQAAREVLNDLSEEELARILFEYGQERYSRKIAKAIVEFRKEIPIEDSAQLANLIEQTVGSAYRSQKIHPATRSFQALRVYVNDELGAIDKGIPQAVDALKTGGRLAVISFHSLEDGRVKRIFRSFSKFGGDGKGGPAMIRLLTRKPVRPSLNEIRDNSRSRSARLRAIEKL